VLNCHVSTTQTFHVCINERIVKTIFISGDRSFCFNKIHPLPRGLIENSRHSGVRVADRPREISVIPRDDYLSG